jgi:hypothetical protein
MANIKEKYRNKLGFIKQMMIARSGIHSVLKNEVDWDYEITDHSKDGNEVYEFCIILDFSGIDCQTCDYELEAITDTINFYIEKLTSSLSNIYFDGELNPNKSSKTSSIYPKTPFIKMNFDTLDFELRLYIVTSVA